MSKKRKYLELSPGEYDLAYRMLITTPSLDSMSGQRSMNAMLEDMEALGDPRSQSPEEVGQGAPPMFEVSGDVVLQLNSAEASFFSKHLQDGIKRFQAWVTRPVPGILDRLEGATPQSEEG